MLWMKLGRKCIDFDKIVAVEQLSTRSNTDDPDTIRCHVGRITFDFDLDTDAGQALAWLFGDLQSWSRDFEIWRVAGAFDLGELYRNYRSRS